MGPLATAKEGSIAESTTLHCQITIFYSEIKEYLDWV